jgi:hypothetical protein
MIPWRLACTHRSEHRLPRFAESGDPTPVGLCPPKRAPTSQIAESGDPTPVGLHSPKRAPTFPPRDRKIPRWSACTHRSEHRLPSARPSGLPLDRLGRAAWLEPLGALPTPRVPHDGSHDDVASSRTRRNGASSLWRNRVIPRRLACTHRSEHRLPFAEPGDPAPVGLRPPKRAPTSLCGTG